ncbi:aspartate-semialdehyde dehydrogenase [bacterium]|nr:aspartate-semialdehyde dehydrogenase [bacterium]
MLLPFDDPTGRTNPLRLAVLGASGLVGRSMLSLLARQDWITGAPLALSSARSAGLELPFGDGPVTCRDVAAADLASIDVAIFSAGGAASRHWAPRFVQAGAAVVDNSSAWRQDPAVPLVVPEVNGHLVGPGHRGIIANPNCSTIQIALPCAALERAAGLREVHATTLQAVSGAGQGGHDELVAQANGLAGGEQAGAERGGEVFPRRIAANAIPEIGALDGSGFFEEELKVHRELRRILARGDLAVTCTATRVPVWNGHAAAVRAVLAQDVTLDEVVAALAAWPGLAVAPTSGEYRTPAEVSGDVSVHVGRVRHEPGRRDAVLFWVVADNLLKGAAWNAVQIAARLAGAEAR